MAANTLRFRTIDTNNGAAHYAQIVYGSGKVSPEYAIMMRAPSRISLDLRAPIVKFLAQNRTAWAFAVDVAGNYVAWKTVKASKRFGTERYRMASVPGGYRGDYVVHYSRVINGTTYSFARIKWNGGLNGITLKCYEGQTTKVLHEWFTPYSPKK